MRSVEQPIDTQTPVQGFDSVEPAGGPITVVVRRRVKTGSEAGFETSMREFIAFALASPGNLGIHVIRPDPGESREYTVVDRFADQSAREAFKRSSGYGEWMRRLRAFTEEEPHIKELGGLAGWFTLPGQPHVGPPPRYKMAVATFIGAYPLTSALPPLGTFLLPGWHPLLTNVIVTALIVIALTWLIMPNLTRLLKAWLFK